MQLFELDFFARNRFDALCDDLQEVQVEIREVRDAPFQNRRIVRKSFALAHDVVFDIVF